MIECRNDRWLDEEIETFDGLEETINIDGRNDRWLDEKREM